MANQQPLSMTALPNGNGKIGERFRLSLLVLTLAIGLTSGYGGHQIGSAGHGERIAVLENSVANQDHRLRRIEHKLDQLIEHEHRR
jgi:hypothetical protein